MANFNNCLFNKYEISNITFKNCINKVIKDKKNIKNIQTNKNNERKKPKEALKTKKSQKVEYQ